MQVVLDANILASGAIAPEGGTLATIIDSWQRDRFGVVLSLPILTELERTLTDPYFTQRLSPRDIATYLVTVRQTSALVQITAEVRGVATHPEDDLVLATAVSAKVDYLVSGDKKLQRVRAYEGVTIVSPREFRDIIERL
jgi:putative PIN family toxin of toxin-antitoxin system